MNIPRTLIFNLVVTIFIKSPHYIQKRCRGRFQITRIKAIREYCSRLVSGYNCGRFLDIRLGGERFIEWI